MKRRLMAFFSVILTFCALVFPVSVHASAAAGVSGDTFRVFLPLQSGFVEQSEDGRISGYTYEYLMRIAQLTGWKYEFVITQPTNQALSEGLTAVKDGTIDFTGSMVYTPELAEEYAYTSVPYGETHFSLICPSSNAVLNERTIQTYPDLRVALIEESVNQNRLFEEYCNEKNIRYTPVYTRNNMECKQLIAEGKADALIGKDVTPLLGYKMVVKFAAQPFYFAAPKGSEALMKQVDDALMLIRISNPNFQAELVQQCFNKMLDPHPLLTEVEQDYIAQKPLLRVAVPINRAPLQDYDAKTGEFSGIIVDLLELISEKSGLEFELIPAENAERIKALVTSGNVEIVAGITHSFTRENPPYGTDLLMTSPIFTSPIVRIYNTTHANENGAVLVDDSIELFDDSAALTREVENITQMFELVKSGKYQEAYVNGYIAQHYLENNYEDDVSIIPTPYDNYGLSLGVVPSVDLSLIRILEQTVSLITQSEVADIVYQNTTHRVDFNLWDFAKRDPLPFVFILLLVTVTILTLVLLLFIKTRRINRLIFAEKNRYQAISQTDRLTQTYNNEAFKRLSREFLERETLLTCGAMLVCDIDNFKSINDTYGHLLGDDVISRLGRLLTDVFREGDIVGRLGGDEFGVLMKDVSDPRIVARRCDQLLKKCKTVCSEADITLSIGAVLFGKKESFEELFGTADSALYAVKSSGKNNYKIELCGVVVPQDAAVPSTGHPPENDQKR